MDIRKIIQEEISRMSNDRDDKFLGHSTKLVLHIPFSTNDTVNLMIDHLCTLYKGKIDVQHSTKYSVACSFKDDTSKNAFVKSLKTKIPSIEFD